MATAKLASLPSQPQPTITSEQIGCYAEVTSLLNQLEAQQKALRAQLLQLHAAGAEQETDSPYLLAFVDQERRTVDWKAEATSLAIRVYGMEHLNTWKTRLEQAAPVQNICQIRVKPNPSFAAGLTKPPQPVTAPAPVSLREVIAHYGD